MDEEVATGWWCGKCEYFEDEDQVDLTNETQCTGCGCEPTEHRLAKVIATVVE